MSVNKQVVNMLKETLADKPYIEQLHLDFMHITDLLPYMDYLSKLKYLKSLSLYGNRLRELPIDMSCLESLQFLDISNNLLNDVDMVSVSLKTLPVLKTLKFPIKKQKQNVLIQNLKNLTLLNDLHIIRQAGKKPLPLQYMTQEGLQDFKKQIMKQYNKIKQMEQAYLNQKKGQKQVREQDEKFIYEMDDIIKNSLKKVTEKEGDLTSTLQDIYFIKTKYQIYELIRARCINIGMDYYGDLGKLIKQVLDVQHKLFQSIIYESLKLVKFQYQVKQIQLQKKEKNNLSVENKMIVKNQQLQKQLKRIKKQKDELLIQMNQLESENKRYTQALVRYAKGDKSGFTSIGVVPQSHFSNPNNSKQNNSQSVSQNFNQPQISRPTQRYTKTANISKQSIPSNYFSNGRNLTLKQLKDTIQQIYEGKVKFDQKNFDGKLAKETMHQYLFTHLNQKYGLKNLTIEAASSIVGGIQTYSTQDNDVAVFGKILRNQVDEEFRNTQVQLKTTINDILKIMVKNKHPFKSSLQIESLLKQKIQGDIQSQEIQELTKFLYNKSDSDKILRKIQILYKLSKPRQTKGKNDIVTRRQMMDEGNYGGKQKKKLKFTLFLQTILDFQLKNRQYVLRPLLNVFKARDTDCDGVVNQQQFIQIIQQLTQQARDLIPEMLMIIDPYNKKSITFTQMARLLANYPEKNPILSRFADKDQEEQEPIQ